MIARFLATISSEMQSVAVGWQIYELTHRPLDLGLVGLMQFAPSLFLFLIAGHAADRFRRQRILQMSYCGFGLCSLLLLATTLHGLKTPTLVYAVMLLNGVTRAFHAPASQAFVPLLVPAEHFANAVAWSSSIFQTATIAGPMFGGLLYAAAGTPSVVYGCAAAAYLCSFVAMSSVRIDLNTKKQAVLSARTLLEGLRQIYANKFVFGAISLDLVAVLFGGAVALLPVYAHEILRTGAWGLGVLRSAPGVGAVVTGIVIAHWPLRRRAGATMLWCVTAFGLFTVGFGLSRNLVLSLLTLFLIGAVDTVSVIVRHTMIQLATPDTMRGRVSAVNTIFIGASNEVGQFESGITAQWFGTVPAVVLGGIATCLVVALWAWNFPALRKLDRLGPEIVPLETEPARDAGA